jgi:hypothetical protein
VKYAASPGKGMIAVIMMPVGLWCSMLIFQKQFNQCFFTYVHMIW